MIITLEDVQYCIYQFGIDDQVKSIELLADGPDHYVPYDVIRKIIKVNYETCNPMVIKFVREEVFNEEIINNQCAFSDLLGKNGLEVPKRWKSNGSYCIKYEKDELEVDVYIESFFSQTIEKMNVDVYKEVGSVIGKIHSVSEHYSPAIGFSLLYNEVLNKDTSYERIWKGVDHSFIDDESLNEILSVYNRRINILKKMWKSLPKGAVQGDIYSKNNIALSNGKIAVFDFNLAGDEVFVGDSLLCWFRTIFDEKMQEELKDIDLRDMWNSFWQGYKMYRLLTEDEKKYLPDIYSILGCLYYTKLLVFQISTGRRDEAMKMWRYTLELLNTGDEIIPACMK